jgi:hypothetical protein
MDLPVPEPYRSLVEAYIHGLSDAERRALVVGIAIGSGAEPRTVALLTRCSVELVREGGEAQTDPT